MDRANLGFLSVVSFCKNVNAFISLLSAASANVALYLQLFLKRNLGFHDVVGVQFLINLQIRAVHESVLFVSLNGFGWENGKSGFTVPGSNPVKIVRTYSNRFVASPITNAIGIKQHNAKQF